MIVELKDERIFAGMSDKYSFPVYDLTPTDEAEGIGCYIYMLKRFLIGKGLIVDAKVDVSQRGGENE